jgi:hypothetical protein
MDYNFDTQQLNILLGQSFNIASEALAYKYKDVKREDWLEEVKELAFDISKTILNARKEFSGELSWNKIGEALDNINKANPKITFDITDFNKADEIQKTLINKMKLAFDRLHNPEMRTTTPRPEFHKEFGNIAKKHFNPEENNLEDLSKVVK